jgi:hypothetical protein
MLGTALLCAALEAMAVTDLTFYAVSDVHFGQSSAWKDGNRAAMPGWLNTLPGTHYPESVGGGPVAPPRGILVPGDLINSVDTALWKRYIADYGVNGEGRIKHPVYDGLGNHDYSGNGGFVVDALRARNKNRTGLTASDETNLHYSWDWDGVHFVMLNLYSGTVSADYDPFGSYTFLEKDLADNVGSSGRPILVMQHFPLPDTEWWPQSEAEKSVALLKKYNCLGILHGHSHARRLYKYQGLDVIDDGTVMEGDIFVFHLKDGKLTVVNNVRGAWGKLLLQKDVSMGSEGIGPRAAGRGAGREFTFTVEGMGNLYAANHAVDRVDVLTASGRVARRISVASTAVLWDRKDQSGNALPPGLYVVRLRTDAGIVNLKLALR